MVFFYNGKEYLVDVKRKNNKNTYIRVRDGKIIITTNYFTSVRSIRELLSINASVIEKMIEKQEKKESIEKDFLLFGKSYDIIYDEFLDGVIIDNNVIRVRNFNVLNKWLDKYIKDIYLKHLMEWYNKFEESIPFPNLKIRKMKTRWGVCNIRNNNITLNLSLFKYDIECLDYVIIHELSHFIHPNHSNMFWKLVGKYCVDYKRIRKKLKD